MKTHRVPSRGEPASGPASGAESPSVSQPHGNAAELEGMGGGYDEEATPILACFADAHDQDQEDEGPPEDFDLTSVLEDASGPLDDALPDPVDDGAGLVCEGPDLSEAEGETEGEELGVEEVSGDASLVEAAPNTEAVGLQEPSQGPVQCEPAPAHTVDVDAPDVGQAYGAYLSAAIGARARIEGSIDSFASSVQASAEAAEATIAGAAEGLRAYVDSAVASAIDATHGVFEDARQRVQTTLETRTTELETLNEEAITQVLDLSQAHQEDISTQTEDLASQAEGLGNERADSLLTATLSASDAISAHEGTVVGSYSGHKRANDIRVTVSRLGTEAAGLLRDEASPAAEAMRESGTGLAAKLREDGESYQENIASGDEETRTMFESALEEAVEALGETSEETTTGLDENEEQVVSGLEEMGETMKSGVSESEELQLQGVAGARDEGLQQIAASGPGLLEPLDTQMAEVEAQVNGMEPGCEEEMVEALNEQAGVVSGQADTVATQIDGASASVSEQFAGMVESSAQGFTETQAAVDEQLDGIVEESTTSVNEAVDEYDASLGEQVEGFGQAWSEEADEKCEALDEAHAEAIEGLDSTYSEGAEEIESNYEEASSAIDQIRSESTSKMSSEAERIANQKWWQRIASAVGNFFLGMFDGLVNMLKGLAVALLVVLAVVLIVAVVILIVKGAAALAAAVAAVAAFVAAAAAVIKVVALILTAIGIGISALNVIGAWMDPDLTTDEKWRASGKGTFEIVAELIPDFGLGGIFKRLRRTPQGTRRGMGNDPSRRVDGPNGNPARMVPDGASRTRAAEFEWAQENGYGGTWETFSRQRDQGRHFDQSRRRWVNDAPLEDGVRHLAEGTNSVRGPANSVYGHATTDWSETDKPGTARSVEVISDAVSGNP